MSANALSTYRQTSIQTARPVDLIIMLYNGAIRFTRTAIRELEAGDLEAAHNNIVRSQDILAELQNSLNFEAGEIATNLAALYDYMNRQLIEGNIKKTKEPWEEVLSLLEELRDAWVQIAGDPAKASEPTGGIDVAK